MASKSQVRQNVIDGAWNPVEAEAFAPRDLVNDPAYLRELLFTTYSMLPQDGLEEVFPDAKPKVIRDLISRVTKIIEVSQERGYLVVDDEVEEEDGDEEEEEEEGEEDEEDEEEDPEEDEDEDEDEDEEEEDEEEEEEEEPRSRRRGR